MRIATIKIGTNCFFNNYCSLNAHKSIEIGNDCIIFGEGVKIYDHNHRFSIGNMPIWQQGFSTRRVIIGNNCWIGSNVIILPRSEVESGKVIGDGCIVKGVIPDGTLIKHDMDGTIITERIQYKTPH